jgi:hypothetical protein
MGAIRNFQTVSEDEFSELRSETVRKVSEVPVEKPCRVPRSSFLADFVLLMPANFTVGALLIPLFGQFPYRVLGSWSGNLETLKMFIRTFIRG